MWSFVPTSNQVRLDIDITNLIYYEVYCKSLTLYCIHSNLVQKFNLRYKSTITITRSRTRIPPFLSDHKKIQKPSALPPGGWLLPFREGVRPGLIMPTTWLQTVHLFQTRAILGDSVLFKHWQTWKLEKQSQHSWSAASGLSCDKPALTLMALDWKSRREKLKFKSFTIDSPIW